jgi:hypothetical protein
VSKNKKGKERDSIIWAGIFTQKWGGAIITKFCTRVKVGYVMASIIFLVDVARFTDSVG